MTKKIDRRVRKTKAQLRAGLARLMQTKSIKEITVKELVEEVDINRSTFYLHYSDIYQMLESIEGELMDTITAVISEHPLNPIAEKSTFPFIEDIFSILSENKDICNALLGPNGDIAFVMRIETLIAENILEQLSPLFPENIQDIRYTYAFCLNGCVGLVKAWLAGDIAETPEHIAKLTHTLVRNTTRLQLQ